MPCCQSLLNERSSRSAGDATDGEADPTCRVSSSGNNITHQAVRTYQPLRNRSWAPRRRDATPSKRYCQLDCSECSNCHSIAFNSRKKYRSQKSGCFQVHFSSQDNELSHQVWIGLSSHLQSIFCTLWSCFTQRHTGISSFW